MDNPDVVYSEGRKSVVRMMEERGENDGRADKTAVVEFNHYIKAITWCT